jgi:tetratricopeptide (TPR) repeat protein
MTLRASLLRELVNPNLSVGGRVELCCELARDFENKGEYEEAWEVLSGLWPAIDQRPDLTGLEPTIAAEVLLRAGVLTGFIGSKNQIAGAQETAKNLISESLTSFESRKYNKKIAEAQIELALCYWRTGELNEARDVLNEAMSRLTIENELKAKAIVRLAIVERVATNFSKALRILTESEPLFQKINNETLKGSYHVTLGTVLQNLWESKRRGDYLDRALIEYAAASYHYERAEHRCYLASVENELGLIYYNINRCEEAHQHLDRARRILVRLKDYSTVAQVDETRACVFLQQGRITEAEEAARAAVYSQEKTGRHALLAEALITHGRALARLKKHGAALLAFQRGFDLSEQIGSSSQAADAALAAFRDLGEHLAVTEGRKIVPGRGLSQEKRLLERDAIKLALENASGSVTHAARSLGISIQALTYMLNTRHKDLLKYRTPVRRRQPKA